MAFSNTDRISFIDAVLAALSKVGDHPFTSSESILWVVKFCDKTCVIADVPRWWSGVSVGKDLGRKVSELYGKR